MPPWGAPRCMKIDEPDQNCGLPTSQENPREVTQKTRRVEA